MQRAVFDTNILIDFSRSDARALDLIRSCPDRWISVVTWTEFLAGVPPEKEEQARAFLENTFDIHYPEESVFERTLELRRGSRLKLPDAMIYAAAQILGVPLVTRNTKDFDPAWGDIYVPYAL